MQQKNFITNPTLFGHAEIIGFGSDSFYVKEMDKTILDNYHKMVSKNDKVYFLNIEILCIFMLK